MAIEFPKIYLIVIINIGTFERLNRSVFTQDLNWGYPSKGLRKKRNSNNKYIFGERQAVPTSC